MRILTWYKMLDGRIKRKNHAMKHLYNISWMLMVLILTLACEENGPDHEPVNDGTNKPGVVSNIQVTSRPGGALIGYTLPSDDDLLYIRGEYQLANGKEVEVKSSFYNNFLTVEGLGDTTMHQVKLSAVTRSEVSSDPVSVDFKPLAPAFWDTYKTIEMSPTFGGVSLKATNAARDELAYLMLEQNEITGEWEASANSLYSSAEEVDYTLRGYDSDSTYVFGLVLRDRYQNYTDTIFQEIKPFFEEVIPSTGFVFRDLPGDAPRHTSTTSPNALWDGAIAGWPSTVLLTQSAYTPFEPHMITVDLGVTAKLSRIRLWDYPEWGNSGQNVYYARGAMRRFEIWGSDEYNPNGELDSTWVKMGEFESIKPSGLPEWVVNNDDIEAGQRGFDYDLDQSAPEVQYLRIRCLENWEGGTFLAIAEIEVYGNDGNPDNND